MNDNDKELPGLFHFPTRKPGQTATGGRKAVADHNERILERLRGIPMQPGTPETDADPRNPNKRS